MSDESDRPQIKVTDKRHFDRTGEKRPEGEAATESGSEGSGGETPRRPGGPQSVPELLGALGEEEITALRSTPPIQELIGFLQEAVTPSPDSAAV